MINWFNVKDYEPKLKGTSIFIGGRGIGKTYSAFSYIIDKQPFMYIRNTGVQIDECCTSFGNPFKKWAKDHKRVIYMKKEKEHAVILEDLGTEIKTIGYAAALSTFENMRGVDLSDVNYVIFDEFIERKKYGFAQNAAYSYFYETVNRNRELLGEPPLVCILLSNAQKLDNPILMGRKLIPEIENMIKLNQKTYSSKSNFVCLPDSEVSELKKNTQFYSEILDTKIAKEALENKFAYDSFFGIKKRPLREYVGLCAIDDIYIYKHKSNGKLYACASQCLNIPTFTSKDNFSIFYRSYGSTLDVQAALGNLECSDFTIKSKLFEILKI